MADWARALLDSTYDGAMARVPDVEQFRNRMRLFSDKGWLARFPQDSLDKQYGELKGLYDHMLLTEKFEVAVFGHKLSADEARRLRASVSDSLA